MKTMARWVGVALVLVMAVPAAAVVTSTTTRNDFTAGGATTIFTFTFKTYATTHVEVFKDGVVQSTGFTTAINANQDTSPGGTVTFSVAPAAGVVVRLQRTVPLTQETALSAHAAFPAKTVEKTHDRAIMAAQQLERDIDDIVAGFPCDANGTCSKALTAPGFVGNASTATALAATPTGCSAGQAAQGIAANGNLTCGSIVGGSDSYVQFNSAGVPGGDVDLTYAHATGLWTRNGLKVGLDGTSISKSSASSVTMNLPSIVAGTCTEPGNMESGLPANAPVACAPPGDLPAGLLMTCFTKAGEVVMRVCNITGAAIDPPSLAYGYRVFYP